MSNFGGIDPGMQGAFVVIDDAGQIVVKHKVPMLVSAKGKNQYNIQRMVEIVSEHLPLQFVCLELIHSMPLQGVVSTFKLGFGLGLWEGILTALKVPYTMVSPQRWQKTILCDFNRDIIKQASVMYAQKIWPQERWMATERSRVPDNNLTDAACLAMYARKNF